MPRALLLAVPLAVLIAVGGSFVDADRGVVPPAGGRTELSPLVELLASTDDVRFRLDVLRGMRQGLQGRRSVVAPDNWSDVAEELLSAGDPELSRATKEVAILLGDPELTTAVVDELEAGRGSAAERSTFLALLTSRRPAQLPELLLTLLDRDDMRVAALRSLAAMSHPRAAGIVLESYPEWDGEAQQQALRTLASRPETAKALLDEIEAGHVSADDLTPVVVWQLRSLGDDALDKRLAAKWGQVRKSSAERVAEMQRYRTLLASDTAATADPARGRVVFNRTCGACHKLFGAGGSLGPELTGAQRQNLDYLLGNIVDPSAVIGTDYRLLTIVTSSGQVISGLKGPETPSSLTVRTTGGDVIVPKSEIEEQSLANVSLMPASQLRTLTEPEVLDLFAYLRSTEQVPPAKMPEP